MTVEQRADDAAAQHSFERLVFLAGLPLRDNLIAIRKAANVQTLRISGTATETREIWSVRFLDTFHAVYLATDLHGRTQTEKAHRERSDWRNLNR